VNLDRRTAAWAAFAATLPIYLLTMNRTIGFIDRGELAAVAWTFGVPHSTGYPTLMLLAGAVAHLVPLRPVLTLNILAAVLVAAGAAVLVLLFDHILRKLDPEGSPASGNRTRLALGAALVTAFSLTWWQQANGFEVYALHALLMPLVTLLFLRWLDEPTSRTGRWFALATGLSFTNHGTTVLLAPAMLTVAALRFGRDFWRRVLPLAPWFALGLLPYVYLPIRSAMNPALDWGHTRTLRGFLHHVSGADYKGWMFPGVGDYLTQLRYVLWRLPWELSWVGVVVAALGAAAFAKRAPLLGVLAGLFIVAGIGFAAGYRIMDIESYLLTALLGLSLLLVAGLARLGERLNGRVALAAAGLLLALNVTLHFRECDESGNTMSEQMTYDQIGPLPPNAVFVSALWDFGQSASLYYQNVEHYRPDVVIVNPDLVRVSWYLDDLAAREPELIGRIERERATLHRLLRDCETGKPYVGREVEAAYRAFLAALVTASMRDRPVFVTAGFPWQPPHLRRVPYHLTYWLQPDGGTYVPESDWQFRCRLWKGRMDAYTAMVAWLYGESRLNRAQYEAAHGHDEEAQRTLASAARFDPAIQLDRVGTLPLAGQGIVVECAKFYARLNATLTASQHTE